MNYKPAAKNDGTGLSWKHGPPRATRASDARSLGALGGYMPLPRGGTPEPIPPPPMMGALGCDDSPFVRVGGCGCGGRKSGLVGKLDLIMDGAIMVGIGVLLAKAFKKST